MTDLETKIAKLVQENQCQIQNAEAVKIGLESKHKESEKCLQQELSEVQSVVNALNRDLDETKRQQEKDRNQSRNLENGLKAQIEKFEAEKRLGKLLGSVVSSRSVVISWFPANGVFSVTIGGRSTYQLRYLRVSCLIQSYTPTLTN